MTVDAARRPRGAAAATNAAPEPEWSFAPTASIAIGEINQTVFACPSCARPLALGARRCPGCRTRLINGVSLDKASPFIAAGLVVGLIVGASGGLQYGISHAAISAPAPVAAAAPSAASLSGSNASASGTSRPGWSPSSTTATTASTGPGSTGAPAISPMVRSALVQVVATNDRLATAEAGLRAALAARIFDTSAVAQILRSVSADSMFAQQLAERVAGWSGSGAVGGQLGTFYRSIHETAANGLVASVQNRAAYRAAATAMVRLLGGTTVIEAAVGASARSAGIDLPVASGAPTEP